MTSADLTSTQATQLRDFVARRLRYLNRLLDRMQRVRWLPEDDMFQAVICARDAMQDLHVAAHYAGRKSGVGR